MYHKIKRLQNHHIVLPILLCLLLINICKTGSLQAQQFNRKLKPEYHPFNNPPDIVVKKLSISLAHALKNNDTLSIIDTRIYLSMIRRIQLNYGGAFNQSGEALFLAEELRDTFRMAQAHEEYGILNYLFKQDEQAHLHFRKSLDFYKAASRKSIATNQDLYRAFYNMLLYYQRTGNNKDALAYIDSCYWVAEQINIKQPIDIYLNEKKAAILYRNREYKKAIDLLNQSINLLTQLPPGSNERYVNQSFLIILYATLGNYYYVTGDISLAKKFLLKSLQQEDLYGEHTFYRSYVHTRYAKLLYNESSFDDAYKNIVEAKNINDQYLNPRNDSTQHFLSIKDRYTEELQRKSTELHKKDIELARNRQDILRFRIYLILAIFVIIALLLIVRNRSEHLKHEKENALNIEKQQQSDQVIRKQNKELTSTMLQLIEKEEVIKKLSGRLEKDPANKSLLSSIEKQSVSLWEAFNTRFMDVNRDFYEKLKVKVPGLSAAELKLCALIKLNFSGKEMAYLLGISEGSVNVARHRLRKKINLKRDMNLSQFIHAI